MSADAGKSKMSTDYFIQASGTGIHILHTFLVKFAYVSYTHFRAEVIKIK